jgi:hypothetical protein
MGRFSPAECAGKLAQAMRAGKAFLGMFAPNESKKKPDAEASGTARTWRGVVFSTRKRQGRTVAPLVE